MRVQMKVSLSIGFAVLLATVLAASPAKADLTPHQEAINQAIDNGCAWLRANQNLFDGSWNPGWGARVAGTGMAALALLSNWEPAAPGDSPLDDPAIGPAIDYLLLKQKGNGSIYDSTAGRATYETSAAVWALSKALAMLPDGDPDIAVLETAIANAKDWIVSWQWDENAPPGPYLPGSRYYGGFGYGTSGEPDLSNSQFALVALKDAGLDSAADTWAKAIIFIRGCQDHSTFGGTSAYDGGMWYRTYRPVWNATTSGATGSMTAAGIWGYRLAGLAADDLWVQDGLDWLDANYTFTGNPAGIGGHSHYYYLWGAAKALLICDIRGEIGGTIPVDPADATAFEQGWYYDFSKYLVGQQQGGGYWNTGNANGGAILDTCYALFVLGKEVGIPYAVSVSLSPPEVAVEPGETAVFDVTIENLGTQTDSYDMDVEDSDLPEGTDVIIEDPVEDVPGDSSVVIPLEITPPFDIALWEDTPFEFNVSATSQSDPGISNSTTGVVLVTVVATPPSQIRHVDELLTELMGEVEAAVSHAGVRNSLLSKLENAEKKKEQGLALIEEGSIEQGVNMLEVSINILEAFLNEVDAQSGKKIDPADAANFQVRTEEIAIKLGLIIDSLSL